MFYTLKNKTKRNLPVVVYTEDRSKTLPLLLKPLEKIQVFSTQLTENVHRLINEGLAELVLYSPQKSPYEYESLKVQIKKTEQPQNTSEEPLINKLKTKKSKKIRS